MRGFSWLAAGGLLNAMGIRARTLLPFSGFHELRDAARRRDAPAISEKVDLRTHWLFDADRAKPRSSSEQKALDQGTIGAVIGRGIGATKVRLIDMVLDQVVRAAIVVGAALPGASLGGACLIAAKPARTASPMLGS